MKILALNGLSGVGKSTIAKKLIQKNPNKYNLIRSYTSRFKRNIKDNDHIFLSKKQLLTKMVNKTYIARTIINDEYYCAFKEQFDEDKINIYIIDDMGLVDLKNVLNDADIYCVRIYRNNELNFVSNKRQDRFKHILPDSCKCINHVVQNNWDLDSVVDEIDDLMKIFSKEKNTYIFKYIE